MFLTFLASEIFISFSILLLIVWPLYIKSFKNYSGLFQLNLLNICKQFTLFVLLVSFLIVLLNFDISYYYHGYNFFVNDFTNFFKLLVIFCAFFLIYFVNVDKLKNNFPYAVYEFFPLVLFNVFGILVFLSSENLLSAYISLELQGLTLSLLFAIKYFSKYSSESALKYFIVSSFSTAILLLGFGFIYGLFGVIHFENILYILSFDKEEFYTSTFFDDKIFFNSTVFALFLIVTAFCIKLGVAPFHMWLIDVYEGAPMLITLYSLLLPKIAYLGFLIKIVFYFHTFGFVFFNFFFIGGIFSIMFGTLGAILQTKIKRLFAYSAVANFGYVLLALSSGVSNGFFVSLYFFMIYIIVMFSIFFVLLSLKYNVDNGKIKSIFELSNIYLSGNYTLSFLFAFNIFAIASIPPFNMYVAKYLLLNSLLETQNTMSIFAAIFIVLLSVVSCFYYIRLIRLIFFRSNNTSFYNYVAFNRLNFNESLLISLFSLMNLFIFIYPELFFDILEFIFFQNINYNNFLI